MSELIHKAEDIDADAIIGLDYETDSIVPIEGDWAATQAHPRHRRRCQACLRSVVHCLTERSKISLLEDNSLEIGTGITLRRTGNLSRRTGNLLRLVTGLRGQIPC